MLSSTLYDAQHHPGALFDDLKACSPDSLNHDSAALATAFRQIGIQSGDRVAIWLPNCQPWLVCFFACVRIGAIAVAVNTRFKVNELTDILERSGAKLLVFWPGFKDIDFDATLAAVEPGACTALTTIMALGDDAHKKDAVARSGWVRMVYADTLQAARLLPAIAETIDLDRPCVLFTTSGTSRQPKLVQHNMRGLEHHAADVCARLALDGIHASLYLATPLCGVFGFAQAMAALHAGARIFLASSFDAASTAQAIIAHRITHLIASDVVFDALLKHATGMVPFPSLRVCGHAAFTPALADIAQRAQARAINLRGLYGSSEVFALFAIQDADLEPAHRALAGGRPMSDQARVRVVAHGKVLAHGEVGELEIAAPSLMLGYFGNPQATRDAITEDGYFKTGDLGMTEADGRFVYLSRLGDSLRLGGYLVNPAEIEAGLIDHPAVKACQVVGVDTGAGERAFAFVIPKQSAEVMPSLFEAELLAWCKTRMAGYKLPVGIEVVDRFPTTASANGEKVQKNLLRVQAEEIFGARTKTY